MYLKSDYGIDKIQGKLPELPLKLGKYNKVKREIKNKLASLGLNETLTYSLICAKCLNSCASKAISLTILS